MLKHHKIALIVLTVLTIILVSLHVFITQNAAFILKKIVTQVSGGKYNLQTSSVKFSYLSEIIQATDIKVDPLQPSPDRQSYALNADTIRIELRSIWPLIFKRSLDIQDVALINPSLVIRGRNEKIQTSAPGEFNLHENLLIIQDQMNKIIHDLRMENFRLDNLSVKIYTDDQHFFMVDHVFLHINDLFANVADMNKPDNLEVQGAIHLWLDKPNLVYPDSNLSVSLDHFDWKSRERNLTIQNIAFSWRQQKEKLDSVSFNLHAVTFSKLQWAEWIQKGHMIFDSVAASTGEFYMQKLNLPTPKDSSRPKGILYLVSPISVNHFAVRQIQSSVMIRSNNSPIIASLSGDSLKVEKLEVDIAKKNPVQLSSIDLAVRSFNSKDRDDKWQSSFTSFRISKNQVLLRDYYLKAKGTTNPDNASMVRVPALTMTGLSLTELTKGKLMVKELTLESPYVQTETESKSNPSKKAYRPFIESLPFLDIKSILVHNGTFVSKNQKNGSVHMEASGVYGHVYANRILRAVSLQQYPNASDLLGMHRFQLNLPKAQILLENVNLIPNSRFISVGKATVKLNEQKGTIELKNISMKVDSANGWIKGSRSIFLNSLNIDSGNIDLNMVKKLVRASRSSKKTEIPIFVKDFSLGNIRVNIRKDGRQVKSYLHHLTLTNLENENQGFKWGHAEALLGGTEIYTNELHASIPSIKIYNESPSDLSNVRVNFQKNGKTINATLPHLILKWPLHQSNPGKLLIPFIELQQPDIGLVSEEGIAGTNPTEETAKNPRGKLSLEIDSIRIIRPHVHFDSKKENGKIQLSTDIHDIAASHTVLTKKPDTALEISVGEVKFLAGATSFQKGDSLQVSFQKLGATLRDLHKTATAVPLYFSINQFEADSLHFVMEKNGRKTELESQRIGITENTLVYLNKDSLLHTLYDSRSLVIQGTDLSLDNPKQSIRFYHIVANLPASTFGLDSFSLVNKMSRDSFFADQLIQKDYITIRSGAIRATDVNLVKAEKDTGITINRLSLDHFFIQPERDMRRPVDSTFKPLLTGMIQKIPIHLVLDTVFLQDAAVVHNVIAAKSGEEGKIFFTGINGWISNVKTFRFKDDDTLRIRVYSKLMGKGNLYMRFRESYRDSLQGFLLTARMGKFWMPDLNPVLVPLTMIKITKGQIDTLWLQAHANDLMAFGSMQINYRKLHVEKLDKQQKKQGFITWLANIIVRTSNHKAGTIYVERLQDKAIFNYWGKIALSGLLTNIRVASNAKYKKKYEAALKKYQLPPHLLDEDY